MAITSILTDWGPDPRIVRVATTDNLYTMTQPGYLTTQIANIQALQNGNFQWLPDDIVAIAYSGGKGLFNVDYTINMTFNALSISQFIQEQYSAVQIAAAYATPLLLLSSFGAHTIIVGNSPIFIEYDYGTVAYTGGGALGLQYGNAANLAGVKASSTEAAATINGFVADNGFTLLPAATGLMSGMAGLGIYLSNDTGAFATGDGTITVSYSYNVLNTVY